MRAFGDTPYAGRTPDKDYFSTQTDLNLRPFARRIMLAFLRTGSPSMLRYHIVDIYFKLCVCISRNHCPSLQASFVFYRHFLPYYVVSFFNDFSFRNACSLKKTQQSGTFPVSVVDTS